MNVAQRFWNLHRDYPLADPPVPEKPMLEAYMFFWPTWERPLRDFAREDAMICMREICSTPYGLNDAPDWFPRSFLKEDA